MTTAQEFGLATIGGRAAGVVNLSFDWRHAGYGWSINVLMQHRLGTDFGAKPPTTGFLITRQADTLTALWLRSYEEHIPRPIVIKHLVEHFGKWRPCVHSIEYNNSNINMITQKFTNQMRYLEEAAMEKAVSQYQQFVCPDPQLPNDEEQRDDVSESDDDADDI